MTIISGRHIGQRSGHEIIMFNMWSKQCKFHSFVLFCNFNLIEERKETSHCMLWNGFHSSSQFPHHNSLHTIQVTWTHFSTRLHTCFILPRWRHICIFVLSSVNMNINQEWATVVMKWLTNYGHIEHREH